MEGECKGEEGWATSTDGGGDVGRNMCKVDGQKTPNEVKGTRKISRWAKNKNKS